VARDAPSIDGYGGGGFRVSGVWRPGSLLIVEDGAHSWAPTAMAEVTPESLERLLRAGRSAVEVLLLGAGAANALPSRALRDRIAAAGIGLEFMDTPEAARLYNLLTADGRRVAAALIAI
jgi:uncharacterized protein